SGPCTSVNGQAQSHCKAGTGAGGVDGPSTAVVESVRRETSLHPPLEAGANVRYGWAELVWSATLAASGVVNEGRGVVDLPVRREVITSRACAEDVAAVE